MQCCITSVMRLGDHFSVPASCPLLYLRFPFGHTFSATDVTRCRGLSAQPTESLKPAALGWTTQGRPKRAKALIYMGVGLASGHTHRPQIVGLQSSSKCCQSRCEEMETGRWFQSAAVGGRMNDRELVEGQIPGTVPESLMLFLVQNDGRPLSS